MAEYIGEVISAATASPKGQWKHSAVRCRRKPGHRKCPGRILVCERGNGDIEWECPSCGALGVIRNWQGSWDDLSEMRVEGEQPSFEIVLSEKEHEEVKKCLNKDPESDIIIYGAAHTKEGIVLRATGEDMQDFTDILKFYANHEENSKRRRIVDQVLNRLEALLGRWSSS